MARSTYPECSPGGRVVHPGDLELWLAIFLIFSSGRPGERIGLYGWGVRDTIHAGWRRRVRRAQPTDFQARNDVSQRVVAARGLQ